MKRKANEKCPLNPAARALTWSCKVSVDEGMELEPKILHYAKGKRSLYMRAALLNYKPKKEDFKQ